MSWKLHRNGGLEEGFIKTCNEDWYRIFSWIQCSIHLKITWIYNDLPFLPK